MGISLRQRQLASWTTWSLVNLSTPHKIYQSTMIMSFSLLCTLYLWLLSSLATLARWGWPCISGKGHDTIAYIFLVSILAVRNIGRTLQNNPRLKESRVLWEGCIYSPCPAHLDPFSFELYCTITDGCACTRIRSSLPSFLLLCDTFPNAEASMSSVRPRKYTVEVEHPQYPFYDQPQLPSQDNRGRGRGERARIPIGWFSLSIDQNAWDIISVCSADADNRLEAWRDIFL